MVRVKVNDVAPLKDAGSFGACAPHPGTVRASSHRASELLDLGVDTTNPLIAAVHAAFAHHLPLELTPDVVFNTVLQGVSAHVATNPEAFRAVFVAHQGRKRLAVRRDGLAPSNAAAPGKRAQAYAELWAEAVAGMRAELLDNLGTAGTGSARRALETAFSTTTSVEATAHAAVFMDAVKHYFEYTFTTCCGIPWIDVAGTRDDWLALAAAVGPLLRDLGLGGWDAELQPILGGIADAFTPAGSAAGFWDGIYKHNSPRGSGTVATVDGWIAKLFLHVRGGLNPLLGAAVEPAPPRTRPLAQFAATPWLDPGLWAQAQSASQTAASKPKARGVELAAFPSGRTCTPFTWELFLAKVDMSLVAGTVGVCRTPAGALKPVVGWLVEGGEPPSKPPSGGATVRVSGRDRSNAAGEVPTHVYDAAAWDENAKAPPPPQQKQRTPGRCTVS